MLLRRSVVTGRLPVSESLQFLPQVLVCHPFSDSVLKECPETADESFGPPGRTDTGGRRPTPHSTDTVSLENGYFWNHRSEQVG